MLKKVITNLLVAVALTISATIASFAQSNEVNGEVMKIDKEQGKVTLRHGPIKNLDMDQMTMVLRVQETKMLDGLAVGDKVMFEADRVNGQITITKMRREKK
ncbi:MAG: copper-binding protein [Candidatus Obscuribacterales bacterium]|jgi:Cu/Ag efflux protein CusF|nr:copper-binding protein [Candidatus Obscuribacterales bacterium]